MRTSLTTKISFDARDAGWAEFVRQTPAAHYMQTCEWAQFKQAFDWSPARVTIRRGTDVVAGAQLLLRRVPGVGAVGWAPRAPVVGEDDAELVERTLKELNRLVSRERIRVLMLQPPPEPTAVVEALASCGYSESPVLMAPTATILLDLDQELDAMQAAMRSQTRRNIRLSIRDGIVVREGGDADLDTFYRLHSATGGRQGFPAYPEPHFHELWRAFRPTGAARLFIAEYEGDPVAGLFVLAHGDTVAQHAMGWSGEHGKRKPNEGLIWAAIKWSKEQGYRWWDFTWIDERAARAALSEESLPDDLRNSVAFFKLGFGGRVMLLPGAYDYVPNRALRFSVHSLVPLAYRLTSVRKAHHQLRWRWFPANGRARPAA